MATWAVFTACEGYMHYHMFTISPQLPFLFVEFVSGSSAHHISSRTAYETMKEAKTLYTLTARLPASSSLSVDIQLGGKKTHTLV